MSPAGEALHKISGQGRSIAYLGTGKMIGGFDQNRYVNGQSFTFQNFCHRG